MRIRPLIQSKVRQIFFPLEFRMKPCPHIQYYFLPENIITNPISNIFVSLNNYILAKVLIHKLTTEQKALFIIRSMYPVLMFISGPGIERWGPGF